MGAEDTRIGDARSSDARSAATCGANLDVVWTVVDGTRLYARISPEPPDGAGPSLPPVVLVHGLSVSSRYLLPAARVLAPFCRVYVPDLPGFGYSQKPPRVLDLTGLADALAAWCRAVGVRRAIFLGNSLGCQTICNLALRHPDLIEAAVFVGPSMDPEASAIAEFFRLVRNLLFFEPLPFIAVILAELFYTGPWWALRTFHYGLNDDVMGKYAQLAVPTLVVRGGRDPITTARFAEQLVALLPQARPLLTIPTAGHCLHHNAPVAFLHAVLPFLREVAAGSSSLAPSVRDTSERAPGIGAA
jgi:pimeloyl-ACP methyl ester carboxylesterase